MNGTNGNEPGYPENALVPYPVIVAATKADPHCAGRLFYRKGRLGKINYSMPMTFLVSSGAGSCFLGTVTFKMPFSNFAEMSSSEMSSPT